MADEEIESLQQRDDCDVIDPTGKMIYFSIRRFIERIAEGDACFICGTERSTVPFNDEHVIPEWILSRYNLHGRSITLPNESGIGYGQYKLPCCETCNSEMSTTFEKPISDLVKAGYAEVAKYMAERDPWLIFKWLCLIFMKTHLKGKQLRLYLDRRNGEGTLADLYDWPEFHHIHCVARSFYTRAILAPAVMGTLFVWPARTLPGEEEFDYGDSYLGRTVLLRLGEIAFIAVLNDSGCVRSWLDKALRRIGGPLSSLQLRELMTRMAFINIHLTDRPQYRSEFEGVFHNPDYPNLLLAPGPYTIGAVLPETFSVEKVSPEILGKMLVHNLEGPIGALLPPNAREASLNSMADGQHSFIFGPVGEFLVVPQPESDEPLTSVSYRFSDCS